MSTQSQDRKVQEARRKLDELREEAQRACNDYKAHLADLVSAVDAKEDEPSVTYSFDGAFQAGARLRDIIEEDVAGLLKVLAPVKDDESDVGQALRDTRRDVMKAHSLLWTVRNSLNYRDEQEGKSSGPTLDEFLEDLILECELIMDRLRKGDHLEVWSRWGPLQLQLRVLRLAIDGETRTDEESVVELAQYHIERAEMTLGEVQS